MGCHRMRGRPFLVCRATAPRLPCGSPLRMPFFADVTATATCICQAWNMSTRESAMSVIQRMYFPTLSICKA